MITVYTLLLYRVGALFFIVMNQVFGNLSAIDLFIRQKALFMYELYNSMKTQSPQIIML